MARTDERVEIPPEPPQPRYDWVTKYTCDGCGRSLTREWPDSETNGNYAHELVITLDREECVNIYRRRDLCPTCLEPIWQAIHQLLKAGDDPWAERDKDYDDEE